MSRYGYKSVAGLVGCLILVSVSVPLYAGSTPRLTGEIAGFVTDSAGIPQMGATVLLYNRQDRLAQRGLTNDHGAFSFAGLIPDLYSVRVSLSSFVPAIRGNI